MHIALIVFALLSVPMIVLAAVLARVAREGVEIRVNMSAGPPQRAHHSAHHATAQTPPRKRVQTLAAPSTRARKTPRDDAQPYTAPHTTDAVHPHGMGVWGTETAPHGHPTGPLGSTGTGGQE